jgi:hypothetical protein
MLLYEDILTGDELFSDAFPVYDPLLCAEIQTYISTANKWTT